MADVSRLHRLHNFVSSFRDQFHQSHLTASNWLREKGVELEELRHRSGQALATASLAGTLALTSADQLAAQQLSQQPLNPAERRELAEFTEEEYRTLLDKLSGLVAMPAGHLPSEEEGYLEQQLTDLLGFEVAAELEGNRLNHSIGIMGGEQHLKRFPGDTLAKHDAFQEAGMAPARGAFGWFTQNGELTQQAIEYEKYYLAVQTLYLPNWNTQYPTLKPWYEFRKMLVVNPAEELAIVAVVGDAGPAEWVQKQFGGSPEVIREGKIWTRQAKGRVLVLFINDPQDKVPLGVIDLKDLKPDFN